MEPLKTLRYFEDRRDAIISAIREIVDIESPSRNPVRSREVVDWVERRVRGTGAPVDVERISVPDGDHLIVRAFSSDLKPTLLLGHTDTVHPVGTGDINPTRVEGDLFYGCGIFDMKANIVLMIEALRFMFENRIARPLTMLLSCDEEIGSHTGRPLVEREASVASRCLVFEPSAGGKLKTGRKGTGMFRFLAHGRPAHAGLEPEKGANAVRELSRHIEAIHDIARPDVGTTVNVCTFKGGTTSNVIPELAEIDIDVRFRTVGEGERVDSELRSIKAVDPDVRLEILGGINRPPLERNDEVMAFYEKARSVAAGFGYNLGETEVGGASDGNFVAAMGIPILDGLGIAGAGAHMKTEHILVSDIAPRATLVTLLLASG